MSKKILLIIGILVIVGIAAFFIFNSKPQQEGESRVGFSLKEFLPFGKNDTDTGNDTTNTETGTKDGEETTGPLVGTNQGVPRLRKLSSEPVAGAVMWSVGTTSVVRFVEKGTGNVYEARSNTASIQRLTNTTIPKIIRAFWLPSGAGFLAQTLVPESETEETSFVKLQKNAASSTNESLTPYGTTISKLPTGIKELSIKPDSSKIFYYTINGSVSNWFTSNPDGTGSVLLSSHPLTEWLPRWISGNIVMMQSKGSYVASGFTYSFDVASKVFKKVGVGVAGISSNPNADSSFSLVSSGGAAPELFLIDNKKTTSEKMTIATLAEKCVWLNKEKMTVFCAVPSEFPAGAYPDSWYKGVVSTEDSLRKVDLLNDIYYNTADLTEESDQKIDVVNIAISPDDSHLIFRNKIDGFLWMLRIKE